MRMFLRWRYPGAMALTIASLGSTQVGNAATLPSGFSERQVFTGLSNPTAMAIAPDGRIFVCQQGGTLRVVRTNGTVNTFMTVPVNSSGERGLLGVAFDPSFASNRFIYVYYTATSPSIHNRVSRFTASATNPDVVAAGSEMQLLNLPTLGATNHNGGAIHVGADGRLYIAVGENAVSSNAESLSSPLGKILRINRDGTIPTDNPFFDQTSGNNRAIWARGLRNPFTFTFQMPNGGGRMHINDVGQNSGSSFEEVNRGIAGANYGWPPAGPTSDPGITGPIFSYGTGSGGSCAIIGSAFYNPNTVQFPSTFVDRYFYGDFCAGFIRTLSPPNYSSSSPFATGISSLVDIAVNPNTGLLYYLTRGSGGAVFEVRGPTTCTAPAITRQPANATVAAGQTATFSVAVTGTQPLSLQWFRNGSPIPGETADTLSFVATAGLNGSTYFAEVSNACSTVVARSNTVTLTVTSSGPTARILTPVAGTLYTGGSTLAFSGEGRDAAGNLLPASALTWEIWFHHNDGVPHRHGQMEPTSGITSGTTFIPDRGETSANVFFRIHLRVTSGGETVEVTRDVLPRTARISIATSPTDLAATLDGEPISTPLTVTGVVGIIRSIGTSSPQTAGDVTYTFDRWSDGGAMTHEIRTPSTDTSFTAFFQGPPGECATAAAGLGWVNRAMPPQTGTFTATFEATPSVSPMSGHVGFSLGAQNAYTGFATIVRFNTSGNIDARNGGTYAAAATIPYSAGLRYRFRLVVDVASRRYSVFVTAPGGTERTLGSNFAFRTEQNTVTRLDTWGVYVPSGAGELSVCNFAVATAPADCVTANAGAGFQNRAFANQTGSFSAEFDATPSVSGINSTMGLSNGTQTAHTGFAAIVRFNSSGFIDARNGGAYAGPSTALPYLGGVTYHFRFVVNVAAHTYSVFVTPAGGSESTVGSNFAFRSEQSGVTQLNNWGVWVGSPTGASTRVCGFTVTGAMALAAEGSNP